MVELLSLEEPSNDSHALIIGGTGMLSDATLAIARNASRVTLVARTEESLERLTRAIASSVVVRQLPADWSDPDEFVALIQREVDRAGHPTLTLGWFHDDDLGVRVAHTLSQKDQPQLFIQVCGSRSPKRPSTTPSFPPSFDYRRVILGYIHIEAGRRWLTHPEICAGVLDALESKQPFAIVGNVDDDRRL